MPAKLTWKPPATGPAEESFCSFSGLFHFLMRLLVLVLLLARLFLRSASELGRMTPVSYFRINCLVGLPFA